MSKTRKMLLQNTYHNTILIPENEYKKVGDRIVHYVWSAQGTLVEENAGYATQNYGFVRSGPSRTWASNGQLIQRCWYRDNMLHGLCETWDNNGKLLSQVNYSFGKPEEVDANTKHDRWYWVAIGCAVASIIAYHVTTC